MDFIFYDLETTGLSPAFDQIVQLGAIACAPDLQEVAGTDSRLAQRCRLMPHIVPSPTALWTTGLTPDQLQAPEASQAELMVAFDAWARRHGPAIFVGHNSLGFDESVLRHARMQSLLSPYLTNTNGNGRADTMRFARAVYLFRPGEMDHPVLESGRPSFKLGPYCRANGIDFADADAHDALYDVEKTLELARVLAARSPPVWQAMLHNAVRQRAQRFLEDTPVVAAGHVDRYNTEHRWICAYVGHHQSDGVLVDLATDPAELADLSTEALAEHVGHETAKPIKLVRLNAQPYAVPLTAVTDGYLEKVPAIPEAERARRADALAADRDLRQRILEAVVLSKGEREPSPHVEERLYDGFIPDSDKPLMTRFHRAAPEERVELIGRFADKRLASFARRLVYFDNPHALPPATREKLDAWLKTRRTTEEDVPWMTIAAARAELAELRAAEGEQPLFDHVTAFLDRLEAA